LSTFRFLNIFIFLRLRGRGFKSQPLHCRVQLWTSCSRTLSSASGVTNLLRYISQFKLFLKKLARVNGKKFLSAVD